MKISKFQFLNPQITKIEYKVNDNFAPDTKDIEITNKFNVLINRDEKENVATVVLEVTLGDNSDKSPFLISLSIVSEFKWDNVYDEGVVTELLSKNAPALLLSYARPMISMLTNASGLPTYNIPFYNFNED